MAKNKMNKNFLIGYDMITYLETDRYPEIGKTYTGCFTRTGEWDGSFIEEPRRETRAKRSKLIFHGESINLRLTERGTYRLAFRRPESASKAMLVAHLLTAADEIGTLLEELTAFD